MASKYPSLDNSYNSFECSLCLEPFKNPKCLPCIHTFCLECLEQYGKDNEHGDEMTCPICRKIFNIPLRGFKELPSNFFIEQINASNKLKGRSPSSEAMNCDICQKIEAKKYCEACVQAMCDGCCETHGKLKASRSHMVVSLEDEKGSEVYMRTRPTYCETHTDRSLELYCQDCNQAICCLCLEGEHATHLRVDLQTEATKLHEQLNKSNLQLSEIIEANASELKQLKENCKESLLTQITQCKQVINDQSTEICFEFQRLVKEHSRKLVDQLDKVKDLTIKKMQNRIEDLQEQIAIAESFKVYVEELGTKGSDCAISQSAKGLVDTANQLQIDQEEFSKGNLSQDKISFDAARLSDIISGPMKNKLIGSIAVNGKTELLKENVFIAVGLDFGPKVAQRVCHISLERPDTVRTIDEMPTWIDKQAAACVVNNALYVVGLGYEHDELCTWNEANKWKQHGNMPSGRSWHCVSVVDFTLYVLGGWVATADKPVVSSILAYDTQAKNWSEVGDLAEGVWEAACVNYKNSIYIFGGLDAKVLVVNKIQVYNLAQRTCTPLLAAMPHLNKGMKAAVYETSAILLGREMCFIYNFETKSFTERRSFKTDVESFGLVIDSHSLYIAGGGRVGVQESENDQSIDEIRCVSVRDVIEDKPGARWQHHAKLPQPACLHAFSQFPISLENDMFA